MSTELIANHIYGPSYVSIESALSYYGLIPERVYTTRSITTNRSKKFENSVGYFEYVTVNDDYYSIGIKQEIVENNYTFLIATPEKALCDLITSTPKLRIQSVKALITYLEEDIRFDMSALEDMDVNIIKECIKFGKKKEIFKILLKVLEQ